MGQKQSHLSKFHGFVLLQHPDSTEFFQVKRLDVEAHDCHGFCVQELSERNTPNSNTMIEQLQLELAHFVRRSWAQRTRSVHLARARMWGLRFDSGTCITTHKHMRNPRSLSVRGTNHKKKQQHLPDVECSEYTVQKNQPRMCLPFLVCIFDEVFNPHAIFMSI